jgi:hypothetical protein
MKFWPPLWFSERKLLNKEWVTWGVWARFQLLCVITNHEDLDFLNCTPQDLGPPKLSVFSMEWLATRILPSLIQASKKPTFYCSKSLWRCCFPVHFLLFVLPFQCCRYLVPGSHCYSFSSISQPPNIQSTISNNVSNTNPRGHTAIARNPTSFFTIHTTLIHAMVLPNA